MNFTKKKMRRGFDLLLVGSIFLPGLCGATDIDVSSILQNKMLLNQTVWKQEIDAQKHEEVFIGLWDRLRNADDKVGVFKNFDFGTLKLGSISPAADLEDGIRLSATKGATMELDPQQWGAWLDEMAAAGFELIQSEWHHSRYQVDAKGKASSIVSIVLHVLNQKSNTRYAVTGKLSVEWRKEPNENGQYHPEFIDASDLTILERRGDPRFKQAFQFDVPGRGGGPVISYDLNRDGLPEIILPGINSVLWNLGQRGFGVQPMSAAKTGSTDASVMGDFNGDGHVDYLCFGEFAPVKGTIPTKGVFLLPGKEDGRFEDLPRQVTTRPRVPELQGLASMAAGDVDGDGDLDVWVSQYKAPYLNGSMPTPYYDANDGYPSYLLLNNGDGFAFTEATQERGLGKKRYRRTYSNSFFDYDEDNDLDLVVVSDFSGVDLYRNNGRGEFKDVTAALIDDRRLFGMAHTFGDFNEDGWLDLYVTGMSSTTASRLEAMDARRLEFPEHNLMRSPMTFGNRLYFGQVGGGFRQSEISSMVARTGWAWGTASLDYDNDGDLEVYIANGHFSGETAKDYCTTFWTDDIYRGDSNDNQLMAKYFENNVKSMIEGKISWNGFEHNFLYTRMSDRKYHNVSFLMGVAEELDSRQVIAEDINADGKVDLLVSQLNYREDKETTFMTIYYNMGPSRGNWIGARISEAPGQESPVGARILVVTNDGKRRIDTVTTGDSYQSQHSQIKHFGIGTVDGVEYMEVTWPSGYSKRIDNPLINQYHWILAE